MNLMTYIFSIRHCLNLFMVIFIMNTSRGDWPVYIHKLTGIHFCQIDLCNECIEWAKQEKRTFLRQTLEARLIVLYLDTANYNAAINLSKLCIAIG